MDPHATPALIVSDRDYRRLEALLASDAAQSSPVRDRLEQELLRAELRAPADVPADVVTMNTVVVCTDESTGVERRLQLVYPRDADSASGKVSVLAPVGAALLGLSVGQSIDWPIPGGRTTNLRVTAIEYQPEASGLPE